MAWPTVNEVKTVYEKLNFPELDARTNQGITRGKNRVKAACAGLYNVSGWDTNTPPALYDLVQVFAFCFASGEGVHTGQRLTPSDDLALRMMEQADKDLAKYASGEWTLLDSTGAVIATRRAPPTVHLRTLEPIFSMESAEDQRTHPDVPVEAEDAFT